MSARETLTADRLNWLEAMPDRQWAGDPDGTPELGTVVVRIDDFRPLVAMARRALELGGEERGGTEPADADRASQTASGGSAAAVRAPAPPSATEGLEAALDALISYYGDYVPGQPFELPANHPVSRAREALAAARQARASSDGGE